MLVSSSYIRTATLRGALPSMASRPGRPCADPIIDTYKMVVSIDGVVSIGASLNKLAIDERASVATLMMGA